MRTISVLVFVLLVAAGFAFYALRVPLSAPEARGEVALGAETARGLLPVAPPAGYYVYRSLLLHFELTYPDTLTKRVFSNANTSTFTFEEDEGDKGFQIFVVPYKGDTVSEERFKMDVPSGVYLEPKDIVIDGARGVAFYSKGPILGDTREVWFIHEGFLYEVTTAKVLDSWLAEIMSTWHFI